MMRILTKKKKQQILALAELEGLCLTISMNMVDTKNLLRKYQETYGSEESLAGIEEQLRVATALMNRVCETQRGVLGSL